jgi:hypothetical protein
MRELKTEPAALYILPADSEGLIPFMVTPALRFRISGRRSTLSLDCSMSFARRISGLVGASLGARCTQVNYPETCSDTYNDS